MRVNHYKWLEKHFPDFVEKLLGGKESLNCLGLIGAHGDKCYSQRYAFEEAGIPFSHGVAIYLIASLPPFLHEVRQTEKGWVDPFKWIVANKDKFLPLLAPIDETDPDVCSLY